MNEEFKITFDHENFIRAKIYYPFTDLNLTEIKHNELSVHPIINFEIEEILLKIIPNNAIKKKKIIFRMV